MPLQIDLREDFADPAHRPELFDEGMRIVAGLFDEFCGEVELLLLVADLAVDDHLGVAVLLIASDDRQLLAGEQVGDVLGILAVDDCAFLGLGAFDVELDRDVGHHRRRCGCREC